MNVKWTAEAFSDQPARVLEFLDLAVGLHELWLNTFETCLSSCISTLIDCMKKLIALAYASQFTLIENILLAMYLLLFVSIGERKLFFWKFCLYRITRLIQSAEK